MDALRWILSLIVFAAMAAVCVFQFHYAGLGGFIGAGLGFLLRYAWPGQADAAERFGNGYVGALMGMVLGFAAFGIGQYLLMMIPRWVG